ncbi:MAG: hypothetical protein ACREBB_04725 [Nitrosotalea sp.]
MDFAKYVDMLSTNSLYFSRFNKLEDPYEGKLTEFDREMEEKGMEYLKSKWGEKWSEISGDATPERREFLEKLRIDSVVNCWHMNEYESAMMWKLYSDGNFGIVIKSTIGRLGDSFKTNYYVPVYCVRYLDYTKDAIGKEWVNNEQLFTKRMSFKHEQEVRAIIGSNYCSPDGKPYLNLNPDEKGKRIPVDLNSLIEEVYTNPLSEDWFVELVKSMTKNYLPDKKVERSHIYSLK